jgi:steroid 5-alpha reductase family enzyme
VADLLLNLAASAGAVVVLMGVVFAISVRRDRHDLIDVAWGAGFALIAVTTFVLSAGKGDPATRVLLLVLTVVWGLRLAVHIGLRNRGKPEDRRYVEIRARGGRRPNLRLARVVYLTQGVVMLLVSLPVQAGQYGAGAPPVLLVLGAAVWLVGFVFETVGDWQLRRFAADPANRGRVLDSGLWRYTRHPNYFGDASVWWGLYLLACGTWVGVATLPAPLVMTALLAKGTGKPLTEKHLAGSRPGYADYVRRTSGFLPLPPRST